MIVGVALAGGRSRRMGRDKALMPAPGESDLTMVQWTVHRLEQVCDEVLIADGGRGLLEHRASGARRSVEDGPGRGPAAGLLGAARAAPGRRLLALACDLPRVPVSLLRTLVEHGRDDGGAVPDGVVPDGVVPEKPVPDWVVPESAPGRLEPLCAVYSPRALDCLAQRVELGLLAPRGLADVPGLDIRRLGPESWPDPRDGDFFANVNTPADYDRLAAARRLRPGPTSR